MGLCGNFTPLSFFNLLVVIAITLTLIYAVTLSSIIEADESSKSVTIPFEQNQEVDFPILSILSVHECPLD